MPSRFNELTQPLVALLLLVSIVAAAFIVIAPFLVATLWAIILVSATWEPFTWVSARLGGRNHVAAALVVTVMMLFVVVPLVLASVEFAQQLTHFARILQQKIEAGVWPDLPQWLLNVPYAGGWLQTQWQSIQQQDLQVLTPLKGFIAPLAKMMLSVAGSFGAGMLMLLISLLIAGVLYANGETIHRWILAFCHKIAPREGIRLLQVAHTTIRGVVNGFIGAAIAQGIFAWFAYVIAKVPHALSLGLATCLVSVIPGGPMLLSIPAIAWLYQHGSVGWAIFVAVWVLFAVGSIDNVVKSLVIGRSSPLPIVLILFGVAGGAISFGLLGVFLGPILLALVYALLKNWVNIDKLADKKAIHKKVTE
ncbi:AI-2E family transporter [Tolumonas lignilytica]|uniref:AI-2E family transporter n=1 Tax=Tolumonas lignilytica TaxID=1283284 RepID=UPI000466904A|nr:AI-2E family transporter [Tolumonas lignilytica]